MYEQASISDIADVVTGKTPSTKDSGLWEPDIPFITPKDLQTTKHIATTDRHVSNAVKDRYSKQVVPAGSVCVSCIGNLGYVGVTEVTSLTNQQINTIVPNDPCDSDYLYYAMRWLWPYFKHLEGQSTTLSIINKSQFKRTSIPWPNQRLRQRISDILNRFDDMIELNLRTNDYLEQLLLARFDRLFQSADSFNGTISDIGEVVGGATPSKKRPEYYCHRGIGWITPRDLSNTSDKFIAHGADDITQAGFDSCSAKKLPAGSVLFSSRAPIGYIAIASDEVTTNQGFKSIVPRAEVGTAFVYCFLVRNKYRIADAGSGTTFPEVSGKTMASIGLVLPDVGRCAEFEEWAKPILKEQFRLEEESHGLGCLRDALLPRLMSGEIDVSKVDLTQPNNHLV